MQYLTIHNCKRHFSPLAKDSPPIPASTSAFVPKTYNHEDIYQNSNRVAQASNSGSYSGPRNNKAYNERQQSIDKLDRILALTFSERGLI
jgi:hypothetical protein